MLTALFVSSHIFAVTFAGSQGPHPLLDEVKSSSFPAAVPGLEVKLLLNNNLLQAFQISHTKSDHDVPVKLLAPL